MGVFDNYDGAQKYVEGFGDKVKSITDTRVDGKGKLFVRYK